VGAGAQQRPSSLETRHHCHTALKLFVSYFVCFVFAHRRHTGIGGVFSKLLAGSKGEETFLSSDKDKNKPWLLW
jgi:hypothetical protein